MKIEISKFTKDLSLDSDLYIICYNRDEYGNVKEFFKDFNSFPEHSFTINWDNNFYDVSVFSKNDNINYKSVKILRNVKCPYVKDGEPRGWFRGPDGRPMRYTGISNSLYFSKSEWDTDFSTLFLELLLMMFTNFNKDEIKSNIKDMDKVLKPSASFTDFVKNHFIYEK